MTRFIAFLLAVTAGITLSARKVSAPDFAYPKKVEARSEARLKSALKSGDGQATLRSLIDLSLARTAVNPASVDSSLALVASTAAQVKDPVTLSMLRMLQARMLYDVYMYERWKYDQRVLPLTPLPADVEQWSGDQFRSEISRLTGEALANSADLQRVGIDKWSDVLTTDRLSATYYPTLYDFAATRAIDFAEGMYGIGNVVPLRALSMPAGRVRLANADAWRVLSLYDDLVTFHANRPAPQILQQVNRLCFLRDHLLDASASGSTRSMTAQLFGLYDSRVNDTEYAGEVLLALSRYVDTPADRDRLLADARAFIKKYPAYPRLNAVKNVVTSLTNSSMRISMAECFPPGEPVTIEVEATNVVDGRIDIYRVGSTVNRDYVNASALQPSAKIGSLAVSLGDTIPCRGKLSLPYTFDREGVYVVVPVNSNSEAALDSRKSYGALWCTRLAVSAVNVNGRATVLAVNPADGSPLKNVDILWRKDGSRVSTSLLGKTDADGLMHPDSTFRYGNVVARLGDFTSKAAWVDNSGRSEVSDVTSGNIYTSLPLYHHGDSLEWAAVLMHFGPKSKSLLAEKEVTVTVADANGQEVDKSTHVTDAWGRVGGSCELPALGLSGRYSISVRLDGRQVAWNSFTVSDYKLPTFTVETNGASTAADGTVTLSGIIRTYSGFALGGATVKLTVSALPWSRFYWNAGSGTEFFRAELAATADGTFSLKIPGQTLDDSPAPAGPYRAEFEVTSPSGESQSASMVFSRKPVYSIFADLPQAIDVTEPVRLNVKVTDTDNIPVNTRVSYTVTSAATDSIVVDGGFMSDKPELAAMPKLHGRYDVCLRVDEGGDSIVSTVVFYDPRSEVSPVDDVLWSPQAGTQREIEATGSCSLLVGAASDTHILYTLADADRVVERRWIDFPAGMRTISVEMPQGVDRARVNLHAVARYRQSDIDVSLVRAEALRTLVIKAESMRDRLQPGSSETWTFTVGDSDGRPEESAVILGMYNASIDALQSSVWRFNSPRVSVPGVFWSNTLGQTYANTSYSRFKPLKEVTLVDLEFETYGRQFATRIIHIRGAKLMATSRSAAAGAANDMLMLDESADAGVIFEEKSAVAETADDSEAGEAMPKAEASPGEPSDRPFAYRDSEVTLAFFRPMLTTDADGRLSFTFTVPDANTTWHFNALAFTRSLLSASMQKSLVASKPVMVQPNLPRYLRQGDRAEISALVMNNTDEQQNVATVIEIFDPANGRIISSESSSAVLAPKASATALITVDTPSDMPMLGYRVKSSTATFADGEQTAIPVLEAAQPLIVSEPFYIAPGEKVYTRRLPKSDPSARVTLEFCENPAWYVVTALPGLASETPNTAPSAAGVLFSAAVADGIIRSNPAVAKALTQWAASDRSDSTLVSMLSRNADLKIALLQATPWMMDARSDTERMERLSLLFDRKAVDSRIAESVETLARLRRGEGGWAWTADGNDADRWATMQVLGMLADLNRLGYMPKNPRLADMTASALKWIDAKTVEDFRRNPEGNFTEYVFMRDRFATPRQSSAAERVSSATVQQLLGRWKDLDAPGKAVAAIILDNHNYSATSRQILESLREYAETSPEKGMWWPSVERGWWSMNPAATTGIILDAFAQCDPGCADIDRIRQWLVLQKQTQMWGNCVSASRLVASFLAASGKWIAPARGVEISVGGALLDVAPSDRTLGYLRADISSMHPSDATLTIAGEGATPSWGAVYCVGKASMGAIEPHSVTDLSVEKKMVVVGPDGSVREATGKLAVGQKVRVTLVIKCGRAMDYVAVVDNRPACFEPVDQLPGYVWSEGTCFYRENSDAATSLFIRRLGVGTYVLNYDMWVNSAGVYTMGAATVQSQMAPSFTANSAGAVLEVNP